MAFLDTTAPDFNRIELIDLYRAAFGYRGLPFPIVPKADSLRQLNDFDQVANTTGITSGDEFTDVDVPRAAGFSNRKGVMGTAYFMPVRLAGIALPNEPIVSARLSKHILKTAVAGSGSRSSIKELTGFEDIKISIEGIAVNQQEPELWPEDHLANLVAMFQKRQAITIVCALTRMIGVRKVVIESLDIKPQAGYPGSFPYSMSLISDEDYAYQLLNR
jgi:hypothetical protein